MKMLLQMFLNLNYLNFRQEGSGTHHSMVEQIA